MLPDMDAAASDQNQRPRPYKPPPPSRTTMRTMMRIVVKSMSFSPVGALAATAAQIEQSISHDWHSSEHYCAVCSPALTWISDEAHDASSRPVQIDAGPVKTLLPVTKVHSWERCTAPRTAPDRQQRAERTPFHPACSAGGPMAVYGQAMLSALPGRAVNEADIRKIACRGGYGSSTA